MQRQITDCDLCSATDLKPGYVTLSIAGDRAGLVRSHLPGNRNSVDLCDACAQSLADWVEHRRNPEPTPEPAPPAASHADAPTPASETH